MSPASAAGVLECLRTKDAEDTDGRRTTCLILGRGAGGRAPSGRHTAEERRRTTRGKGG
jgi:hypothetical protein